MTRQKLVAAISLGIKRGGGDPEKIADAIELAFELEGLVGSTEEPRKDNPETGEPAGFVPVNLESIEIGPQSIPKKDAATEPAEAPLVTLATERDVKAMTDKPISPLRVRSLSPITPAKSRMKLEDAVKYWMDNAPEKIWVDVEGREEPVLLERSVAALPGKPEDLIKLGYKHPMVDATYEVQHCVPVSEIERGVRIQSVIDILKEKARVMYRPRPKHIEPRRPTPNPLRIEEGVGTSEGTPEDQDRMAAAARSGAAAVEQMSNQIRGR